MALPPWLFGEEGKRWSPLRRKQRPHDRNQKAALIGVVFVVFTGLLAWSSRSAHERRRDPSAALLEVIRSSPVLTAECDPAHRLKTLTAVRNGSSMPIFNWGWEATRGVHDCPGDAVARLEQSYRERPSTADMLDFMPCDLWRLMENRTLWIVGDSQMMYFYRVLKIFLTPLHDVSRVDVNVTSDPATLAAIEKQVVADNCCGVTIPFCTYYAGGARLCHIRTNYAAHMIGSVFPNMGLLGASREDVLIANFGLWHHKRDGTYGSFVQAWADYVVTNASSMPSTVIWRDNTPQHFDIENGEFPHPEEAGEKLKHAKGCVPMNGTALDPATGALVGENAHVAAGGWRNIISNPIIRDAGIPQLDTWNETVPLWDMHTPKECTHWCAPGAHNIWIYGLWKLLDKIGVRPHVGPSQPLPGRLSGRLATEEGATDGETEAGGDATDAALGGPKFASARADQGDAPRGGYKRRDRKKGRRPKKQGGRKV